MQGRRRRGRSGIRSLVIYKFIYEDFLAVAGLILGLLLIIVGPFALPFVVIKYQTSSGEHTGYVVAAERTGWFFKTNTVYVKTNTTSSQEDTYCVIDPAVFAQLQQYAAAQQHVDLFYVDWFKKGIQNCAGEQAIMSIASATLFAECEMNLPISVMASVSKSRR